MSVVIVAGLFAIVIVCMIGGFITLNTLINQGYFGGGPGIQAGQSNPWVVSESVPGIHIGFDFTNQTPADSSGDDTASSHLFVHQYPLPEAGFITAVTYLNDRELGNQELPETIILLILRPVAQGLEILHRLPLADDDQPAIAGIKTLKLESPLPVEEGDIFAHWQAGETGPIPLNYEDSILYGLSAGQFGFSSGELEVGQIIRDGGFSGQRDYFINLIFEPAQ
jgi:hypothetical protein